MKIKQLTLIAVLAAVLLIGWVAAMRAATSTETVDTQNALVALADTYESKGLHVRAIPKYQEALTYQTENNPAIQSKLLAAYLAYGDAESYKDLAEAGLAQKTVTEAELLQLADIYLSGGKLKEALTALETGMEQMEPTRLREMYEANRYAYTLRQSQFATLIPTADNSIMPGYDGTDWYYADDRGRVLTGVPYESATRYSAKGYACVKQEGTYYVITTGGARYGLDETGMEEVLGISDRYIYGKAKGTWSFYNADFVNVAPALQFDGMTMPEGGYLAVKKGEKWGLGFEGMEAEPAYIFEDVAVNALGAVYAGGAGMVKHNGLWYLVDPGAGKLCETGFAFAKAPEEAGALIAVANEDGRWGYINTKGELVIDYQFDDAKSFSCHVGAVRIGERWGYVSEAGVLVIDLALSDAQPFRNGCAVVVNAQGAALLSMTAYKE